MFYRPELGILGNINLLFTERNKTNNNVFNNKAKTDEQITNLDEFVVEREYKLTPMELGITE